MTSKPKTRYVINTPPGRVAVEMDGKSEMTPGGIVLPESAGEKPTSGVVFQVGQSLNEYGERLKYDLKAGHHVLIKPHCGQEITLGGKTLLICRFEDLVVSWTEE